MLSVKGWGECGVEVVWVWVMMGWCGGGAVTRRVVYRSCGLAALLDTRAAVMCLPALASACLRVVSPRWWVDYELVILVVADAGKVDAVDGTCRAE